MTENKRALGSDLARLDATTDEDIARQIAEDPDTAPELTEELLERAELFEGDRFIRRVGRPPGSGTKELVTLRIDRDVLAHFRATGPGWQTRINDALRATIPEHVSVRQLTKAQLVEEILPTNSPRALQRDKGVSMSFTSIRDVLGQPEGREGTEQAGDSPVGERKRGDTRRPTGRR